MSSLPVHLPDGFTPSVAVGDIVEAGHTLAVKSGSSETAVINIAKELSLPVSKAGKAVKKNPGDTVAPGEVIASRAGFLGVGEQKVVSSVAGKVTTYERRTGELTLAIGGETGAEETYPSPVAGTIVMCDNGKIVIDTEAQGSVGAVGVGGSIQGKLYYIQHEKDTPVPLHLLSSEVIGKIVMGREFDHEGLTKIIAMEALGVITTKVKSEDVSYFREKATSPLIQISEAEFSKLAKNSGKHVSVDGAKKQVTVISE